MSNRLRIDHVNCVSGPVTVARVQLSHQERAASGMASAQTTEGVWQQVVAQATLSAVRALINGDLDVTLDAVAEVRSGRHPIVVVTMTIGRGRGEIFLSGTAPLVGDRFAAVAKAVLHGLNRWVEPYLAVSAQEPADDRQAGGRTTFPQVRSN